MLVHIIYLHNVGRKRSHLDFKVTSKTMFSVVKNADEPRAYKVESKMYFICTLYSLFEHRVNESREWCHTVFNIKYCGIKIKTNCVLVYRNTPLVVQSVRHILVLF
jgi:hypothetical protein